MRMKDEGGWRVCKFFSISELPVSRVFCSLFRAEIFNVSTTVDSALGLTGRILTIVRSMHHRRSKSTGFKIIDQFLEPVVFWAKVDTALTVSGQCHKKQTQKKVPSGRSIMSMSQNRNTTAILVFAFPFHFSSERLTRYFTFTIPDFLCAK